MTTKVHWLNLYSAVISFIPLTDKLQIPESPAKVTKLSRSYAAFS